MLRVPTVAVDDQRVALIMPIGATLTVTSDTSFEKRMIEVSWGDRKLAMFGSDLTARGEENFQADAVPQDPDSVDPQEIPQLLQGAEVMNDIPSGIPHSDGTDRIKMTSGEYEDSRGTASAAMKR